MLPKVRKEPWKTMDVSWFLNKYYELDPYFETLNKHIHKSGGYIAGGFAREFFTLYLLCILFTLAKENKKEPSEPDFIPASPLLSKTNNINRTHLYSGVFWEYEDNQEDQNKYWRLLNNLIPGSFLRQSFVKLLMTKRSPQSKLKIMDNMEEVLSNLRKGMYQHLYQKAGDIDVYFRSHENAVRFCNSPMSKQTLLSRNKGRNLLLYPCKASFISESFYVDLEDYESMVGSEDVFLSLQAIRLDYSKSRHGLGTKKLKPLHPVYGPPIHVMDSFDFSISRIALEGTTLIYDYDAPIDTLSRSLNIVSPIQNPIGQLERVRKYVDKGFKIADDSLLDIANAILSLPPEKLERYKELIQSYCANHEYSSLNTPEKLVEAYKTSNTNSAPRTLAVGELYELFFNVEFEYSEENT